MKAVTTAEAKSAAAEAAAAEEEAAAAFRWLRLGDVHCLQKWD